MEIEGVNEQASLDEQFKQLEAGGPSSADKLLEDLKTKMNRIEGKT